MTSYAGTNNILLMGRRGVAVLSERADFWRLKGLNSSEEAIPQKIVASGMQQKAGY